MERRLWCFTGDVQGVGFRWRARRVAERHGLAGWVCNRPDGTVALEAEGEPGVLDAFLADLTETMADHIAGFTTETGPAQGSYRSFTVEYDR